MMIVTRDSRGGDVDVAVAVEYKYGDFGIGFDDGDDDDDDGFHVCDNYEGDDERRRW